MNTSMLSLQLCMLGALAGVDVLVTDARSLNWILIANFAHQQLDPPGVCDPIIDGQKLCILHHNINCHNILTHSNVEWVKMLVSFI